MSKPNQLIIDNVLFPTTTRDRYSAHPVDVREQIEMISTRMVEEVRGTVWEISYAYDYMGDEKCRECLGVLRRRGAKTVLFLPDNGLELLQSDFLVTSLTPPTLAFYTGGVPKWHNLAFTLREVRPHA